MNLEQLKKELDAFAVAWHDHQLRSVYDHGIQLQLYDFFSKHEEFFVKEVILAVERHEIAQAVTMYKSFLAEFVTNAFPRLGETISMARQAGQAGVIHRE